MKSQSHLRVSVKGYFMYLLASGRFKYRKLNFYVNVFIIVWLSRNLSLFIFKMVRNLFISCVVFYLCKQKDKIDINFPSNALFYLCKYKQKDKIDINFPSNALFYLCKQKDKFDIIFHQACYFTYVNINK
jgi:hypothetical protein